MSVRANARVAALLEDPRLWTLRDLAAAPTVPSGHAALDAQLPGGGWPLGAITELMPERPGIGELSLLAPTLAQLSATQQRIAVVGAPYLACAPGWAQAGIALEHVLLVEAARGHDALWAAEQTLRSSAFGAVLLWAAAASEKDLRRLQLAAEQGNGLLFMFRPPAAADQSSPAALRLRLAARARGLSIHIVKSRGGRPRALTLNALVMPVPAAPALGRAG